MRRPDSGAPNQPLAVTVLASLFLVASICLVEARPNIVFILADDVGAESMDKYGGTSWPTPRINSIADEGMLFANAHSSPTCAPTRAQFLTGRYQFRNGIVFPTLMNGPLSTTEETTFASVLKRNGYATGLAGKWNLSYEDGTHPSPLGSDGGIQAAHIRAHGFEEHLTFLGPTIDYGLVTPEEEFTPYRLNQWACDFIRRKAEGSRPFFLQYSMGLVHWERDASGNNLLTGTPLNPDATPSNSSVTQLYGPMMTYMDNMVGRVLDTIDELGIAENTVVVFAGDNGTWPQIWSQWNGRSIQGGKNTHKDTASWVPLYVRWPGVVAPGSAYDGMTDFSDLFPTFLEIGEATVPNYRIIDGISFLPQLRGEESEHREMIYVGQLHGYYWQYTNAFESVRDKRWKLVVGASSTLDGLYDVSNSPLREVLIPEGSQTSAQRLARVRLQAYLDQLHNAKLTETGADSDGDGQTDYAETLFGTDPVSGSSWFQPAITRSENGAGEVVHVMSFATRTGRRYQVLQSTSLGQEAWQPVGGAILGTGGEYRVTLPGEGAQRFYRVSVEKVR